MQYVTPDIEKGNALRVFRDWDGRLFIRLLCGGWRTATRLEAALLRYTPRLVLTRRTEP
jgi:hypothetical protein